MISIDIHNQNGYSVNIGSGITYAVLKDYLNKGHRVLTVTDSNVGNIYSDSLNEMLKDIGCESYTISFTASEGIKSPENLIKIWNMLSANSFRRCDTIIALGGGTVGDLAGFAAATYMRGIDVIQIPTTLLSTVDSSVGGKTAVNLADAKNSVGAFKRPRTVICDTDYLRTLPDAEYKNGMAEVIKYALACDSSIIPLIENGNPEFRSVIEKCVSAKKKYVESDEFDTGLRMVLNFGHTIGHAIEVLSDYGIPHGTAVAAGYSKLLECEYKSGMCEEFVYSSAIKLNKLYGLPTGTDYSPIQLCDSMKHDKKISGQGYTLVLLKNIGMAYTESFNRENLLNFLYTDKK